MNIRMTLSNVHWGSSYEEHGRKERSAEHSILQAAISTANSKSRAMHKAHGFFAYITKISSLYQIENIKTKHKFASYFYFQRS